MHDNSPGRCLEHNEGQSTMLQEPETSHIGSPEARPMVQYTKKYFHQFAAIGVKSVRS
jgi:hypothetical protein